VIVERNLQNGRCLTVVSGAVFAAQRHSPQTPVIALGRMNLRIAAIRSGSEPIRKLSSGSFQRWLETPLSCPKCDATYNLAVDWDQSNDRWFSETSRPLITLLKKAIMMGHSTDHRVTHFETEGVVVESVTANKP
jgi:hypothetical protein